MKKHGTEEEIIDDVNGAMGFRDGAYRKGNLSEVAQSAILLLQSTGLYGPMRK